MSSPAPKSDREVLEDAIRADPDDIAAHAAYADLLMEAGDPRGEFVRVQLALEDESLPREERDKLKARERELLDAHEREWLGELAPVFLDPDEWKRQYPDTINRHRWSRGHVTAAIFPYLEVTTAQTLVRAGDRLPMLRELRIEDTSEEGAGAYARSAGLPAGVDEYDLALYLLRDWPPLANLRVFHLGELGGENFDAQSDRSCHTPGALAHMLVSRMRRLEELCLLAHGVRTEELFRLPLPHLRVLRVDHLDEYALHDLAANPTLTRLTHLLMHPHALRPGDDRAYIGLDDARAVVRSPHLGSLTHLRIRLTDAGDDLVREIVESGILKRLKVLDLRHGIITDRGAKMLAECPDLKHLQRLDVSYNALSDVGVAALLETGIDLLADKQDVNAPNDEQMEYLFYGDIE